MKKTNFMKITGLIFLFVGGLLIGCDDEDSPATPPTITADSPIAVDAGSEMTITGNITDAVGIATLTLVNADLGLNANLTADGETSIPISFSYTVPATTEEGSYDVALTVTNTNGLSANATVVVNVTVPVSRALYIAGGIQWSIWDPSYAYEFAPDPDNMGWYETILPSWPPYDDGAGNIDRYDEFKILGQHGAWGPDNWGLDANGNVINDENSTAFDLPPMDLNPAYYTVRFNLETLETEFTHIPDNTTPRTDMAVVIDGVETALTGNFEWYGDHLFGAYAVAIDDAAEITFAGTGDYAVGFEEGGERSEPISWVNMTVGGGDPLILNGQAGTYTILYDDFAKKAVIWKD